MVEPFASRSGLPSLRVAGVALHSLQFEAEPEYSIPMPIKTFMDTAAIIKSMDLVITVCTSVAHLAAAMSIRSVVLFGPTAPSAWARA